MLHLISNIPRYELPGYVSRYYPVYERSLVCAPVYLPSVSNAITRPRTVYCCMRNS